MRRGHKFKEGEYLAYKKPYAGTFVKLLKYIDEGTWLVAVSHPTPNRIGKHNCSDCKFASKCLTYPNHTCLGIDARKSFFKPSCKLEGLIRVGE